MKLTLLGVTGRTGQHVARQAIGAGHDVTAIFRRPDAIPETPFRALTSARCTRGSH
jgi:uncharacterized protein YbjT (DUF2867 family)